MSGMKEGTRLGWAALLALAVWACFAWPLPRHVFDAIPVSGQGVEREHLRTLIPGDHLQLLYQFWLFSDMAGGGTPWFHDLYEFNTGDDAARVRLKSYFPVSPVFAAGRAVGGNAFGVNLAGWVFLWLSFYFTWRLARRYADGEWMCAAAALIALTLPYRWMTLLGGSPTGYAMAFLPMVALGLDLAVRDGRIAGGVLAGLGLLLASWNDAYILFFGTLLAAAWTGFAFVARIEQTPSRRAKPGRILRALAPALVLGAFALGVRRPPGGGAAAALAAAGGRPWEVVGAFSPERSGFWSLQADGLSAHIFLGAALLLPLFGLLVAAWAAWRAPRGALRAARLHALLLLLLAGGLAVCLVLALGPRGPRSGWAFAAARALVPHYDLLRQPAKIFCLLPLLLAVIAALAAGLIPAAFRRPRPARAALLLLLGAGALHHRARISTDLTALPPAQAAYAAVVRDARGTPPRPAALALPLWPGDAQQSSVYLYDASLYRLRLVNGYHPVVGADYRERVFERFRSLNQGAATPGQLDELERDGVHHLLLHEDLFPEPVSPFPVAGTIARLLKNPRLELMIHADRVWAFRIRPASAAPAPAPAVPAAPGFAARRWECEAQPVKRGELRRDASAAGGACMALEREGDFVSTATGPLPGGEPLTLLVRLRGHGEVRASVADFPGGQGGGAAPPRPWPERTFAVDSDQWTWQRYTWNPDSYGPALFSLTRSAGRVEADLATLCSSDWPALQPGEALELPAAFFFRAGDTADWNAGTVRFEKDRDPESAVLYGPKLPLFENGTYAFELETRAPDAPRGTVVGRINVRQREAQNDGWVTVAAGRPALVRFVQTNNLPVHLVFAFDRTADVELRRVILRREK